MRKSSYALQGNTAMGKIFRLKITEMAGEEAAKFLLFIKYCLDGQIIKSIRIVRWVRHVERMWEMRSVYNILVGKPTRDLLGDQCKERGQF